MENLGFKSTVVFFLVEEEGVGIEIWTTEKYKNNTRNKNFKVSFLLLLFYLFKVGSMTCIMSYLRNKTRPASERQLYKWYMNRSSVWYVFAFSLGIKIQSYKHISKS